MAKLPKNKKELKVALGYYDSIVEDRGLGRITFKEIPVVKDLDKKILTQVINKPESFDMGWWHKDKEGCSIYKAGDRCGTTHCRAGWAIHLAGKKGYDFEKKVGSPDIAGALIYAKSAGYVPDFGADEEDAITDLALRATGIGMGDDE